jgi:hypothetical protein
MDKSLASINQPPNSVKPACLELSRRISRSELCPAISNSDWSGVVNRQTIAPHPRPSPTKASVSTHFTDSRREFCPETSNFDGSGIANRFCRLPTAPEGRPRLAPDVSPG